jgi:benzoate/toluate 1,2-dioxygenase alpha subunit
VFRLHPDVFADPELFELEQKYIFERTWGFLAFESQLAKPNDFIATHIGRVPVIVARDAKGNIGAFLNACRHKGAMLCRT